VENDVSIGTRVPVSPGSHVVVSGRYFFNGQGGLVDFTHHDPAGGQAGWILFAGKVYSLGQLGLPQNTVSLPLASTLTSASSIA